MQDKKKRYINIFLLIAIILLIQAIPFNLFIKNIYIIGLLKIVLSIVAIIYYFYYIKKESLEGPRLRGVRLKDLLFLPFLLIPFSNLIVATIGGFDLVEPNINYLLLSIARVFSIAVVEELLFRSLLLNEFRRDKDKLSALIYSSLIFGATHLLNISSIASILPALIQAIYTAGLGLLLGLIYIKSNNIAYPIIFHFLFNYFNDTLVSNIFIFEWNYLFYIINTIVAIVFILYGIFIYYIYKEDEYNASEALDI